MLLVYIMLGLILVIALAILFALLSQAKRAGQSAYIALLQEEIRRIESTTRTEFSTNRKETADNATMARRELSASLSAFEEKLSHLTATIDSKLSAFNEGATSNARESRMETRSSLEGFRKEIAELSKANERKLEQMRETVDEKLQQTLETRLGESFRLVSERLESVHKGLGDMQTLATGVGDLKRVLSNVKTRGVLGEYQLANLLEQILTPDQYGKNIKTSKGSNALVEFAIKMPGKKDTGTEVWLPIDSKFPKDAYDQLQMAYDEAIPEAIELRRNAFIRAIKKSASDVSEKYVDPPGTTNFAILFLPFESLFAEVLREPGLFENIRQQCRVIITGPTTLAALLNSLQVGFHTLAIEKRSAEVWQLLSGVKSEFGKFSGLLQRAQVNIKTGLNQLDEVMGRRTRAIEDKLGRVETSGEEQPPLLPDIID
jgi:DNA recombination protein RmuC